MKAVHTGFPAAKKAQEIQDTTSNCLRVFCTLFTRNIETYVTRSDITDNYVVVDKCKTIFAKTVSTIVFQDVKQKKFFFGILIINEKINGLKNVNK